MSLRNNHHIPTMLNCERLMAAQMNAARLITRFICNDAVDQVMSYIDWDNNAGVVAMRLYMRLEGCVPENYIISAFRGVFLRYTSYRRTIFVPNKTPPGGRREVDKGSFTVFGHKPDPPVATPLEMYNHVKEVTNGNRDNCGRPVKPQVGGCLVYNIDSDSWKDIISDRCYPGVNISLIQVYRFLVHMSTIPVPWVRLTSWAQITDDQRPRKRDRYFMRRAYGWQRSHRKHPHRKQPHPQLKMHGKHR